MTHESSSRIMVQTGGFKSSLNTLTLVFFITMLKNFHQLSLCSIKPPKLHISLINWGTLNHEFNLTWINEKVTQNTHKVSATYLGTDENFE